MKTIIILIFCAAPLFAGYNYYYSDALSSINATKWNQNGNVTATSGGLTATTSNGGSLISKVTVPGSYPNNYEVKVTLTLTASGGTYVTFIHATANAQSGPSVAGSAYAVELQNPTFNNGVCTGATLALYQIINGQSTQLGAGAAPCHNGMVLRTVLTANGALVTYIDNWQYLYTGISTIPSGQPGIGARGTPAGNSISQVALGPLDTVAPPLPDGRYLAASAFPNHVDVTWPGFVDDVNGIGMHGYSISRNGVYIGSSHDTAFTDTTVAANTTYSYSVTGYDYHYNGSSLNFSVTTPAPQAVDPREIGVRPLGSYWGGGGEQIDMRSGNLNFSVPLLRATGRGGWGVTFQLSYNSQNWRQDAAGVWDFGRESGYGYGWTLQAGALLPVWSSYWAIHHYLFIDGSGAQYRLDQNDNNIWRSKEGIYVSYDPNTGRLYFPDGSFWVMGAVSGGSEWDAGTEYPTLIQDTNGNQINVSYMAGWSTGYANSSGRIYQIQDSRSGSSAYSYQFTYDAWSHLHTITNGIGTAESYTFSLADTQTYSPFGDGKSIGMPGYLNSLTQTGTGKITQFTYNTNGGELTQVTFPYGGSLQWAYASYTLNGRTLREVQYRYLTMSSGGAQHIYQFTRDSGDSSRNVHLYGELIDNDAGAAKVWWLQTDTGQINSGLVTEYDERNHPAEENLRVQNYTYAQDSAGNPYVSSVTTTMDQGLSTQIQKKTTQVLDSFGNVTQTQIYDWGNLTTPIRTYTNTYVTASGFTSRYINNRLESSTVSDGTHTVTLASVLYDGSAPANISPVYEHDATYGTSFYYRGNPTSKTTPAGTTIISYDIGGNVVSASENGHSIAITVDSGANYAAPKSITTSVTTNYTWSSFFGLNSQTGANGDVASISYDGYARPASTTSPYGAVTG